MCCCSQKTINWFSKCLCMSSTILFFVSLISAYLLYLLASLDLFFYVPIYNSKEDRSARDGIRMNDFLVAYGMILTTISLFISIWSCCVRGIKSKLCYLPFSILVLIWFLIQAAIVAGFYFQNKFGEEYIT